MCRSVQWAQAPQRGDFGRTGGVQGIGTVRGLGVQRLGVAPAQHLQPGCSKGGQQLVALLAREVAGRLGDAEQDLQVDLVVGTVDAGGVVDGVAVDAPVGEGVLDAGPLREPEVAAKAAA